jgi:hypothetical protein
MKTMYAVSAVLILWTSMASATSQKWTAGYDNFNEPLNYKKSKVTWSVSASKLTITYTLIGATPGKLYQVDLEIFCTTFPTTFGQFPVLDGNPCVSATRQGVTATSAFVEVGVVTTDMNGNGSFRIVVGPVAAGTYNVEFRVLDGAGAGLIGGAGQGACWDDENVDFQSPGPYGTTTTIVVP